MPIFNFRQNRFAVAQAKRTKKKKFTGLGRKSINSHLKKENYVFTRGKILVLEKI